MKLSLNQLLSSDKAAIRAGKIAAALLLLNTAAAGASHIQTPAQLRAECESSGVVQLDHPTKIALPGPGASSPLPVNSGCTLVLGANSKLETEFVQFSFAGPLVIQSAHKTEIKLVKTRLSAPEISINLPGVNSALSSSESTLEATAGNLTLTFGAVAKLEMINRLIPGPQYGLSAAGSIQISAFGNFTGLLDENFILAQQGFSIAMSQSNGLLKMSQVLLDVPQGGISITAPSTGEKALFAMTESHLRARDGILVQLAGRESSIGMKQVSLAGWNGVLATGAVTVQATTGSGVNGKIELSEVSMFDVPTVKVLASLTGREGSIKVEKSDVFPEFDLQIETGVGGKTEVKENRLSSSTIIRIAAGPDESGCIAQPNSILGQPLVLQLCP